MRISMAVPLIASIVISALSAGCLSHPSPASNQESATISGEVWWRERIALPPKAELFVSLEEITRQDVPSETIALYRGPAGPGSPVTFSLRYDSAKLSRKGRYALRAKIRHGKRLLFTSTEDIPAFRHEVEATVRIMVTQIGGRTPSPGLVDTYWKLVELKGQPTALKTGERELHLVLAGDSRQARGFAGCNSFSGSYSLAGARIKIGPLAATKKLCLDGMEQEGSYFQGLGDTAHFTIGDGKLTFLGENKEVLLRFEAVALQ